MRICLRVSVHVYFVSVGLCVCVHVCVLKLLGLLLSLPPVVPVSRRRSRVRWPRPAAGDWWVVWRVCGAAGRVSRGVCGG